MVAAVACCPPLHRTALTERRRILTQRRAPRSLAPLRSVRVGQTCLWIQSFRSEIRELVVQKEASIWDDHSGAPVGFDRGGERDQRAGSIDDREMRRPATDIRGGWAVPTSGAAAQHVGEPYGIVTEGD